MLKADEPAGNVLFEEKQKLPRWIKWVLRFAMLATVAGMLVGLVTENDKKGMMIGLALVIPVVFLVVYLHSNIQLEKTVTSNGLYYRWKPWHRKFRVIEREDIMSIDVRKFPFMNYGFGWYPGYGRYHNSSRGEGLQLILKNGNRIYFSTSDIDSFKVAVNALIEQNIKTRSREF